MISYKKIVGSWDRFFFEEKPTESIALFRFVWMAMLLVYYVMDVVNIQDFYGPHALISLETTRAEFPLYHLNLFHLVNPSYEFTYGLMAVFIISLFFSMIGLFTRYSLIVALICMTSFHQRNIWILSSSETLMRIMMILLVCSPCGHTFSVDSLLAKRFPQFKKKENWPVWALRLIQIQLSVVYIWTVWHKLKGDNWIDGTAVYYATRLENMINFSVPYLMDSMIFLKMMTWGTLLLELALGTLIWVKEIRKPVIVAGILFHVGIEYIMCIPFFEINMMILLMVFITPEEARTFIRKTKTSFLKAIQDSTMNIQVKEKLVRSLGGHV